jgi:hypothetical protein
MRNNLTSFISIALLAVTSLLMNQPPALAKAVCPFPCVPEADISTVIIPQCSVSNNVYILPLTGASGGYTCVNFSSDFVANANANCMGAYSLWYYPRPAGTSGASVTDPLCAGHAVAVVTTCTGLCVVEPQTDAVGPCWGSGPPPNDVIQQLINKDPEMVQCQQKYGFTHGSYVIK